VKMRRRRQLISEEIPSKSKKGLQRSGKLINTAATDSF